MIQPQLIRVNEHQQVCCDENTPCVPNDGDYNSNNKKTILLTTNTTKSLAALGKQQQIQQKIADGQQQDHSHKGENRHSKNTEELDIEYLKPDLKLKIKDKLEKNKSKYGVKNIEAFYMSVLEHEWMIIFEAENAHDIEFMYRCRNRYV
jgi:hypothetical protein